MDAQRDLVAVEDVEHVEHVEDVAGAAYEAEHLGDADTVIRPRVVEERAELRLLEWVETRLQTRFATEGPLPYGGPAPLSSNPCQQSPSDLMGPAPPRTPGLHGLIGCAGCLSANVF
ncbi:hypothetical protein [Streptomyces canus]|uniref:hypothetical protein n=1 Tax=Streptomyces canus TaxID=58343 RepID=UPI0003691624|nr:hypothetical protein [Streptomyces canus]